MKKEVHRTLQKRARSQKKKKNLTDLADLVRFRKGFEHKALRKLRG